MSPRGRARSRTSVLLRHLDIKLDAFDTTCWGSLKTVRRVGAAPCTPARTSADTQSSQEGTLPIFVLMPSLPSCEEHLHIFEPRYRLMLKDCLEQKGPAGEVGEFGMCWSVPGGDSFSSVGTLLRVQEHMPLPDGRTSMRCIAIRRFRVLDRGTVSGLDKSTDTEAEYNTATVEWFDDQEETDDLESAGMTHGIQQAGNGRKALFLEARSLLSRLNDLLLRAYPAPEAKWLLLTIHGPDVYREISSKLDASSSVKIMISTPDEDSEFCWWVLGQLVPLPPDVKADLVLSQLVSERMARAVGLLESLCSSMERIVPDAMELIDAGEDAA